MKRLKLFLSAMLVLSTVWSVSAQSSKHALSGHWKLTDAYVIGADDTRDMDESSAVKADLTEKGQIEYQFTDTRLTILGNDKPVFLYNYSKDAINKISIDEPVEEAFPLMRGLEMVDLSEHTLILKSHSDDNSNVWIYQVFTRK